jgi:hypothetical protein
VRDRAPQAAHHCLVAAPVGLEGRIQQGASQPAI